MGGDQTILSLILSWLPLLIIMLVFGLFVRNANARQAEHVREVTDVNYRLLDANEKMLAELVGIKNALEKNGK